MSVSGGSSGGASIDTNAAHIAALLGIAAAGVQTLAAASDHGHPLPLTLVTANYAVLATDVMLVSTNVSGVNSITLPAANVGKGRTIIIVNGNAAGGFNATMRPAGADTITNGGVTGLTSVAIGPQGGMVFTSDGTSIWYTNNQVTLQASGTPQPIGAASLGSSALGAHGDHVHATRHLAAQLAADVAVTAANTFQTLASVTVATAGVYVALASAVVSLPATLGAYGQIKINGATAGDTASDETQTTAAAAGVESLACVSPPTSYGAGEVVSLQGTGSATTVTFKAALHANGVGNNATTLVLIQVG